MEILFEQLTCSEQLHMIIQLDSRNTPLNHRDVLLVPFIGVALKDIISGRSEHFDRFILSKKVLNDARINGVRETDS